MEVFSPEQAFWKSLLHLKVQLYHPLSRLHSSDLFHTVVLACGYLLQTAVVWSGCIKYESKQNLPISSCSFCHRCCFCINYSSSLFYLLLFVVSVEQKVSDSDSFWNLLSCVYETHMFQNNESQLQNNESQSRTAFILFHCTCNQHQNHNATMRRHCAILFENSILF